MRHSEEAVRRRYDVMPLLRAHASSWLAIGSVDNVESVRGSTGSEGAKALHPLRHSQLFSPPSPTEPETGKAQVSSETHWFFEPPKRLGLQLTH